MAKAIMTTQFNTVQLSSNPIHLDLLVASLDKSPTPGISSGNSNARSAQQQNPSAVSIGYLDAHIARNQRLQAPVLSILLSKPTPLSDCKALGIYLISMSMQLNELLRHKAMIANSNDSDSEFTSSDATIKADQETDLEYLYYRLFTDEIGITSKQPAFVDNPYLGRVRRDSIAPPQTVLQLKRRLCSTEETRDFSSFILYRSASNQSLMDDGDRMHAALGSTMDQPVELVVKNASAKNRHPP